MSNIHVIQSAGVPTEAPTALNQHFIDTLNRTVYLSSGVGSVSDWGHPASKPEDIQVLWGSPPEDLATLELLTRAINNDANYAATIMALLASRISEDYYDEGIALVDQYGTGEPLLQDTTPVEISDIDYTLSRVDFGRYLRMDRSDRGLIRIPKDLGGLYPHITIEAAGVGKVRFHAEEGVVLKQLITRNPVIAGKSSVVTLKKVAPNRWTLHGTLEVAAGNQLDDLSLYVELP